MNCSYLMRICADRNPEGSRQAEVGQLDFSLRIDEEVLRLQVSMKNSVRVTEGQTLQQLEQITLQTQINSEIHSFFLIKEYMS